MGENVDFQIFWFIEYFLGLSTQQKFYWPSAGEALRVRSVPHFMHWGRRGGWMIPGCKTTVAFRCISPFCKPPQCPPPPFASTLPFLFWRLQKRAPLVFLSASCKKVFKKNKRVLRADCGVVANLTVVSFSAGLLPTCVLFSPCIEVGGAIF